MALRSQSCAGSIGQLPERRDHFVGGETPLGVARQYGRGFAWNSHRARLGVIELVQPAEELLVAPETQAEVHRLRRCDQFRREPRGRYRLRRAIGVEDASDGGGAGDVGREDDKAVLAGYDSQAYIVKVSAWNLHDQVTNRSALLGFGPTHALAIHSGEPVTERTCPKCGSGPQTPAALPTGGRPGSHSPLSRTATPPMLPSVPRTSQASAP